MVAIAQYDGKDDAELLGEVVSWDIHGSAVAYSKVREALRDAGLDEDAAHELRATAAFSRACKDLKKERAIDKVCRNPDKTISFQLTRKRVEKDRMEFDYETTVTLDPATGAITCPRPAVENQARELFAHAMQTRTNQDVTRLVQALFKRNADLYPLNRKGVAYFSPIAHREFTNKIDSLLATLGGRLQRFPVPRGTATGNASVREAVQSGLRDLLKELSTTVDQWDETTRQSSVGKAYEKWSVIQHKVDIYAAYLGSEQERLLEELATAKAALKKKVLEVGKDDPDAPVEAEPVAAS